MKRAQLSIAIIGAGIGGLALAAGLRQLGISARIYEQATQFARVGAGIQMGPNAMKALSGLGAAKPLLDVAFRPPSMRNRDWDTGRMTFELPLGDDTEREYGAPYLLLHRGDLHRVLDSLVPRDIIQFGTRVVDVEQRPEGVELAFEDGTRTVADAVVGADGVHSRVREALLGVEDASFTGRVAYRAVFPSSLVRGLDLDPSVKWWGADRHIVTYFVSRGDEVYFTTSVPDDEWRLESWSATGDLGELRDAFAGFHPDVTGMLAACPSTHKWAIYERDPLATWQADRTVLLGDACHPMTPYMAQGAATAIEDAVVLARCLAQLDGDRDGVPEAFGRYERCRKARTTKIQLESRANRWLRHPTSPHWVYTYDAWHVPLEPDQGAMAG